MIQYQYCVIVRIIIFSIFFFMPLSLNASQVSIATPLNNLSKIEQQRKNYKTAKKMLSAGRFSEYSKYKSKLDDYSLVSYLDYRSLLLQLKDKNPKEIKRFSEKYASFPFVKSLPYKYLSNLGKNKKWSDFITYFPDEPRSEKLRCYYYRATLFSGDWQKAWQGAHKLWLKGSSVHSACDPLFDAWQKAGGKTDEQILERMALVYQSDNSRLLKILSKALKYKKNKKTADKILRLDKYSGNVANYATLNHVNTMNQRIVMSAFKRLARQNVALAVQQYQQIVNGQHLNIVQRQTLADFALFRLFTTKDKKLIAWRKKMIVKTHSKSLLEFRIRIAIRQSNWIDVEWWIKKLTEKDQLSTRWQYWLARAELKTEKVNAANTRLRALLGRRDFYSIAAAEYLNTTIYYPVSIAHLPATVPIEFKDALIRIHELLKLKKSTVAKLEWQFILTQSEPKQALELAKYANLQQWSHFAILATIKGRLWDYINLRLPIAYQNLFDFYSKKTGVSKITMMALSRQESALSSKARSPVGARGLMQIMPATARYTAKKMGINYQGANSLFDLSTNINIGTYYLKGLLKEYNNNRIFAFIGYNAGPNRVKRWRKRSNERLDVYAFIETIPFKETRGYVQNILMFERYYRDLLGISGTFITKEEYSTKY